MTSDPETRFAARDTTAENPSLEEPQGWAMLLDFDGTLIEIANRPGGVKMPPDIVTDLLKLRERLGGALAFVSGREIAQLDRFLDPARFDIAGIHGAEIRIGDKLYRDSSVDREVLTRAGAQLGKLLAVNEGWVIEDKGAAVAVHWRQAPHLERMVLDTVIEIAAGLGSGYRVQQGKAVAEILPVMVGKASAIDSLLAVAPYKQRRAIFLGDDLTDEPGLELVRSRGGISVHIGDRTTKAEYRLDAPHMLRRLISSWAQGADIDPARDFSR